VLGGIGFGFFVDELGKFITSDNDYFFKPAAAIIYLLFLGLFFVTRWLRRRSVLTPKEALVNAADLVKEAALHDLDVRERKRALELLDQADPNDPLVEPLRRLMLELQSLPVRSPSRMTRWARAIRARYYKVIAQGWFPHVFRTVFVLVGIVSVVQVFGSVFDLVVVSHGIHIDISITRGVTDFGKVSLYEWLNVAAVVLSTTLLWIGVVRIGSDRLAGYIWIERSLLVAVCVTQVFVFVQSQFTAVFGLAVDVTLLVTVRAMIRAEHKLAAHKEAEALPPAPPPPAAPERAPEPAQEAPAPS
jgi:hypothetical protein